MDGALFFKRCHRFDLFIMNLPWPFTNHYYHHPHHLCSSTGATDSRKRKMKEVAAPQQPSADNRIDYFALRGKPLVPPPGVPHVPLFGSMQRPSQVQSVLNAAASSRPFSYRSLLTAPDPENYLRNFLHAGVTDPTLSIDQIFAFYGENLKNMLSATVEKLAEEKAAKKLKEKELQLSAKSSENEKLEKKAELYKGEVERLLCRARDLEKSAKSLAKGLKEANEARTYAETVKEDAESYYVDPVRLGPVRLDCKACEKKVATVMMWPCRHVCVCTGCDGVTKACPVCHLPKLNSAEIFLPYD